MITLLEMLGNEGNFKHNSSVIKSGEGKIMIAKRDKNAHNLTDYLPCQYCKKFLFKDNLWAHTKKMSHNFYFERQKWNPGQQW